MLLLERIFSYDPLNALTKQEYMLILEHAEREEAVKVVVWTGRGRAFSAGAALGNVVPCPLLEDAKEWFRNVAGFRPAGPDGTDIALKCLTKRFWEFPKPTICAVNGMAGASPSLYPFACLHFVKGWVKACSSTRAQAREL